MFYLNLHLNLDFNKNILLFTILHLMLFFIAVLKLRAKCPELCISLIKLPKRLDLQRALALF